MVVQIAPPAITCDSVGRNLSCLIQRWWYPVASLPVRPAHPAR